jgi:hypothetical protein
MSVMQKIGKETERVIVKGVLAGSLGAGVSYFMLKREDTVSLLGMDLKEWQLDAVLLAISSMTGHVLG